MPIEMRDYDTYYLIQLIRERYSPYEMFEILNLTTDDFIEAFRDQILDNLDEFEYLKQDLGVD